MNKAITSFWKGLFFRSNVSKIRKTIMKYLADEGIKSEIEDGSILMTLDDCIYSIDFELENDYPRCDITLRVADEDYQALELSQKTFIADKVNTDELHLSTVRAFDDSIMVTTSFYFANKKMLLSLFYDYFVDLKETVNYTMELTVDKIQTKEIKRPIGFTVNINSSNEKEQESKIASVLHT